MGASKLHWGGMEDTVNRETEQRHKINKISKCLN